MRRFSLALAATVAVLGLAPAAYAGIEDGNPYTIIPPEPNGLPGQDEVSNSPCGGNYWTWHHYIDGDRYNLSHGVNMGCGVPASLRCVSSLTDPLGLFPSRRESSGYQFCYAGNDDGPDFQNGSVTRSTHVVEINLDAPYTWERDGYACRVEPSERRYAECTYVREDVVPVNYNRSTG